MGCVVSLIQKDHDLQEMYELDRCVGTHVLLLVVPSEDHAHGHADAYADAEAYAHADGHC